MTAQAAIPPLALKPKLRVLLCAPRSFCAGVVRAIETVERALNMYGPPVYLRHEIVNNRYVVDTLRAKGAIFEDARVRVTPGDLLAEGTGVDEIGGGRDLAVALC